MGIYNNSRKANASVEMSIDISVSKSLGLLIIGLIFIALGIWLIKGGAFEERGQASIYVGWLVTVLFGIRSFQIFIGLTFGEKSPFVISSTGLRDARMFSGEISWSAISSISTCKQWGSSTVWLDVEKKCLSNLKLRPLARLLRMTNLSFGFGGLHMSSNELDISFKEFQARIVKYATVHNPDILINVS